MYILYSYVYHAARFMHDSSSSTSSYTQVVYQRFSKRFSFGKSLSILYIYNIYIYIYIYKTKYTICVVKNINILVIYIYIYI